MKTFFDNHKWFLIWGGLIIVTLPIALNYILLIPLNANIVGDSTHWLSFWGGYLGAIISSAVAFIILYIQYRNNKKENTKNRQLQLNVLQYQQEIVWLNNLREVMIKNLQLYHSNNLIDIRNMISSNNDLYHIMDKTRSIIDNLRLTETTINMMIQERSNQEHIKTYYDTINDTRQKYISVLRDIQIISAIFCNKITKSQLRQYFNNYDAIASVELKNFVDGSNETLSKILDFMDVQIKSCTNCFEEIGTTVQLCISTEQARINSILNDCI